MEKSKKRKTNWKSRKTTPLVKKSEKGQEPWWSHVNCSVGKKGKQKRFIKMQTCTIMRKET